MGAAPFNNDPFFSGMCRSQESWGINNFVDDGDDDDDDDDDDDGLIYL